VNILPANNWNHNNIISLFRTFTIRINRIFKSGINQFGFHSIENNFKIIEGSTSVFNKNIWLFFFKQFFFCIDFIQSTIKKYLVEHYDLQCSSYQTDLRHTHMAYQEWLHRKQIDKKYSQPIEIVPFKYLLIE
jgi:hypothetical protein